MLSVFALTSDDRWQTLPAWGRGGECVRRGGGVGGSNLGCSNICRVRRGIPMTVKQRVSEFVLGPFVNAT